MHSSIRSRVHSSAVVIALTMTAFESQALAQPQKPSVTNASSEAAAESLYVEGEALIAKKSYALACTKFQESQRLDPQLGTLLHLADCFEQNGQVASAWVTFREAVELATKKNDGRDRIAKERARSLEARLPKLTLSVSADVIADAPDLVVERDGQRMLAPTWGVPIPVDPGKTTITVRARDRAPYTETVELKERGREVVVVPKLVRAQANVTTPVAIEVLPAVLPAAPRSDARSPSSSSVPTSSSSSPTTRTTGALLGTAGALSLGTSLALAVMAKNKGAEADMTCPSNVCSPEEASRYEKTYSSARGLAIASGVTFAIGAGLLATGLYLLVVMADAKSNNKTGRVAVKPGVIAW